MPRSRILTSQDRELALFLLKQGREGAIVICRNTKPTGEAYLAAAQVAEAIDRLAQALGEEPDVFHTRAHG